MSSKPIIIIVCCLLVFMYMSMMIAFASGSPMDADAAIDANNDWWNIMVLGNNSLSNNSYVHVKPIAIISLNAETANVKITWIKSDLFIGCPDFLNRDNASAADVHGNSAPEVQTVNAYFGIDIEDYVILNLAGVVGAIDQLGGIEIDVSEEERKWINILASEYMDAISVYDGETSLEASGECIHLNGILTMSYLFGRYEGADYARIQRRTMVFMALVEKIKKCNPLQIASVASVVIANIDTNLILTDVLTVANYVRKLEIGSIEQFSLPVDGTIEEVMKDGVQSVCPDFCKNKELLHAFIYG